MVAMYAVLFYNEVMEQENQKQSFRYISIPLSASVPGTENGKLTALISTKASGDMRFTPGKENSERTRFFASLGIQNRTVLGLTQVHSRLVIAAEGLHDVEGREGDGIVADRGPLILSVTVADCMPIFIFDTETGSFGILHSGWKGTGILKDGLEVMEERFRSHRGHVSVVLGPCIGSCCYEVDLERYSLYRRLWGEASGIMRDGKYYLDMRKANLALAERLSLHDVRVIDRCTACSEELSSFRRDGENFRRMIALIGYMNL